MYVVPAARPLAAVHVQDPARHPPARKPVTRGQRVPEWPKDTILGWTVCNQPMYADGLWVPYAYDSARDGKTLLCPGCGGPPRAEEITLL